jgi:DNA-binding MarR family transcriptional regulator
MAEREQLLLDLFTEVAIVEHLVRNHVETISTRELTAGQFGLLNYFVRNRLDQERKSVLAWSFQVTIADMEVHIGTLEQRGLLARIGDGDDQLIGLTAAGRSAHADAVRAFAPEIEPLMAEFTDEDLDKTVGVLKEIRRVFDNLPERRSASA